MIKTVDDDILAGGDEVIDYSEIFLTTKSLISCYMDDWMTPTKRIGERSVCDLDVPWSGSGLNTTVLSVVKFPRVQSV